MTRQTLDEMNQGRREQARYRGQHTYSQEYVESWPACVECDQHLRNIYPQPEGIGLFRQCGCPGIIWRSSLTGNHGWDKTTA